MTKRIVDAVAMGLPWRLAAQAAGVGPSTLREWKQRGRDGEEPYAAFLARLETAEGVAAKVLMGQIASASTDPKHWTAAAWILERRHPELFALKRPLEADEPGGQEQTADDLDVARAVVSALESRKAG